MERKKPQLLNEQNKEGVQPPPKKPKKNKKKKRPYWVWVVFVFFLAIALSLAFGVLSEMFLSGTGVLVAVIIVLVFIVVSIVFDMIGTAVLSCDATPFRAMASRKVRGGKQGLYLIKNSAKIASICADVIGDVCGVLSGAAGASLLLYLVATTATSFTQILLASLVSAIIAGLTIAGKAMLKLYATNNASKIVLLLGKILSVFSRTQKPESRNPNKTTKNAEK